MYPTPEVPTASERSPPPKKRRTQAPPKLSPPLNCVPGIRSKALALLASKRAEHTRTKMVVAPASPEEMALENAFRRKTTLTDLLRADYSFCVAQGMSLRYQSLACPADRFAAEKNDWDDFFLPYELGSSWPDVGPFGELSESTLLPLGESFLLVSYASKTHDFSTRRESWS